MGAEQSHEQKEEEENPPGFGQGKAELLHAEDIFTIIQDNARGSRSFPDTTFKIDVADDKGSKTQGMAFDCNIPQINQGSDTRLLYSKLMEIQKYKIEENRVKSWAHNLRFLNQESAFEGADFTVVRDRDRIGYVAVSYCWSYPRHHTGTNRLIRTTDNKIRPCKAPSDVLRRARDFASTKLNNCDYIWIDQESINQDDPLDQEIAIQSMDTVFHRAALPIGVLQAAIESQSELHVFEQLLASKLYNLFPSKADVCRPYQSSGLPEVDFSDSIRSVDILVSLLERLLSDPWWSRSWILQEAALAHGMHLLIGLPCSKQGDHSPQGTNQDLHVDLSHFMGCVREFVCLWLYRGKYMCSETTPKGETSLSLTWPALPEWRIKWHGWFQRMSIFQQRRMPIRPNMIVLTDPDDSDDEFEESPHCRYCCSAREALLYMETRENSVIADKIAILANLCNYHIRLDTNALTTAGYGLSACLYALALLNGDLTLFHSFPNAAEHIIGDQGGGSKVMASDLSEFSWGSRLRLPLYGEVLLDPHYVDAQFGRRLFFDCSLLNDGLRIKGWLWKRGSRINVPLTQFAAKNLLPRIEFNPAELDLELNLETRTVGEVELLWTFAREVVREHSSEIVQSLTSTLKACTKYNIGDMHQEKRKRGVLEEFSQDEEIAQESITVREQRLKKSDFIKNFSEVSVGDIHDIVGSLMKRILVTGFIDCYQLVSPSSDLLYNEAVFYAWSSSDPNVQFSENFFTPWCKRKTKTATLDHDGRRAPMLEAITWPCVQVCDTQDQMTAASTGVTDGEKLVLLPGSARGIVGWNDDALREWTLR